MIKAFTIQINGISEAVTTQKQLTAAIKKTKTLLADKDLRGAGYKKLQKEMAKLKTLQKGINDGQRLANQRQEIGLKKQDGSYRALNARLVKLRNEFKNLSAGSVKRLAKKDYRKYQH